MGVESAVVKFEVVMNAELGPIGEEKLAVVERSSDGGMNASDRILEDPEAITKAAETECAEKQNGQDPDRGGNRGSWRRGLRLHHSPEGRGEVWLSGGSPRSPPDAPRRLQEPGGGASSI